MLVTPPRVRDEWAKKGKAMSHWGGDKGCYSLIRKGMKQKDVHQVCRIINNDLIFNDLDSLSQAPVNLMVKSDVQL